MKQLRIIFGVLFFFLILFFPLSAILGNDTAFVSEIIQPDNQISKSASFFDLDINSVKQQELEILLTNKTNKQLVLEGAVTNAWTTINGVIDYSSTEYPLDSTLKNPLSSLLVLNSKEIVIPPMEQIRVTATLNIPDNIHEGVVLGGIQFCEKGDSFNNPNESSVYNKYAVVKGVKLTKGEIPNPNIEISNAKVSQLRKIPAITVNIKNTEATMIGEMSFKTEVRKENSQEILQSDETKPVQMAPNSNVDLPIYWKDTTIQPGKYTVHATVEIAGKTWDNNLNFTVDDKTSKKIANAEKPVDNVLTICVVIIVVLILLSSILAYLLIRKNKK
ncbi:hypothetical protein AZF37_00975 [endosymbiont 'TC1' of Trimyema compressum]|uniref:DUF916 and DUF3324 domain-containing protein n=1 Tax=endosymbiont 'TC1' of Trimyema compressum TaxID=243899 RepID=UPI0007F06684|nr:DUF916 and DUF3324 domain-containing protein [endosymbiont 'TC1' of Trimyema compressum]AMP19941.1 hypothetical protein AZF37_00975 [endosymbiont 'TC1' of Trimyema compressum]